MIERLAAVLGCEPGDLDLQPITGGYSNRTDLVRRGGDRFVLRRPPATATPDGAHDVLREATVVAALGSTPVPVPTIVARSDADDAADADASDVADAPWYLASFVEGAVLRGPDDALARPEAERHAIGLAAADMLAAVHAVDAATVGIATRSTRGYVERQLDLWHRQFDASRSLDLPLLDEVHEELVRTRPAGAETTLVHGDYHLANLVLDGTAVAGVLDWELATVGDPLADLGLALAYWTEPGDGLDLPPAATDAEGFPRRDELADRYARTSGRDLADLGYYLAFAHWKVACIAEGIHARVVAGATSAGRAGIDHVRSHPGARARAAAATLEGVR